MSPSSMANLFGNRWSHSHPTPSVFCCDRHAMFNFWIRCPKARRSGEFSKNLSFCLLNKKGIFGTFTRMQFIKIIVVRNQKKEEWTDTLSYEWHFSVSRIIMAKDYTNSLINDSYFWCSSLKNRFLHGMFFKKHPIDTNLANLIW